MKTPQSKLTELLDTAREYVFSAGDLRFPEVEAFELPRQDIHIEDESDPDLLFQYGILMDFKKDYDKAISALEKAHHRYQEQGQDVGRCQCMIELAWLKFNHEGSQGEVKSNLLLHETAKLVESIGEESARVELQARLKHRTGLIQYRQNEIGEAVRNFVEAQQLCDPKSITLAKVLDSMAIHYERTADYYRAVKCLRRSLDIKKHAGVSYEMAITAQILGRFYFLMEEYVLGLRCLDFALQLSNVLGDFIRAANVKNDLVNLLIAMGQVEEAMALIEELETENRIRHLKVPQSETLLYKCTILFGRKQYPLCHDILVSEVIPTFQKFKSKKWWGISRRLQGLCLYYMGNERAAIESMGDAMDLFREAHNIQELAKTHFELGKLYIEMGKTRLALTSMMDALKISEQNGLVTLTSYIEDELFRLDKDTWQDIVQKRAHHVRVFDKQPNLLDALEALAEVSDEDQAHQSPGDIKQNGQLKSLISLLRVGQAMAGEREIDKLLPLITEETKRALNADRCTVFLYDKEKNELWSKVASGLEGTQEIRFPAHLGIAGFVAKTGETLNIPQAYDDPRFNKEVDKITGYKTENILCMPMRNRKMEIIGVFQVLNKVTGRPFEKSDEDLLMTITATAGVALENAKLVQEQKIAFESFIKTLSSTIDARDPITAGHSERVSEFSVLLGDEMKLAMDDIEVVRYAALLHDIGKIGIKEEVLTKDGRLTLQEYKHIQKHAYYTYEILKNIHFEGHLVQVPEVAAAHHEKMDGSGYFRRLKGTEIPLLGRILALSDVFDAITSKRHYRSRMPFDKVLSILHRDSGTHFDPDCVESFFTLPLYRILSVVLREHYEDTTSDVYKRMMQMDKQMVLKEFSQLMMKPPDGLTKGERDVVQLFQSLYDPSFGA